MAGVKGNRRIIYTKNAIKDSLLELLKTNDIHQVTVTDICKGADINRGTFYAHYKDAYDLLQCIEDEFFNKIIKYIDETPVEKYYDSLLLKVLELIKENKELCKILICRQGDNKILDKVISIASQADFGKLSNTSTEFNPSYLNYYIRYVVGGCISIIQTWLDNDLPESPKEVVTIINSVSVLSNAYLNSSKCMLK
ncbi:transcriptional regulator, TetR family [Hathewaya proteolytica DSM 3090]|uniref:Transcriptional regulator, TetR family n=1 Tax=Hathewaya proteolytica DSM 3090 TaxID=1121331 RepID=A0A1M6QJ57_9CLOT|nr:TetR/AcrR family transcriptional regulator [Hathewaya proteolytica]SHK20198.1 transcriptional regulator, TetR family [Hathewaya proteolytica DSM 3090]